MEGMFLLRCLRSSDEALSVADKLPNSKKLIKKDLKEWDFKDLTDVCFNAGWLSPVETSLGEYDSEKLVDRIRKMRNFVHPGNLARSRPWIESDERDYEDAK
jgi:hypothetical protein